MPGQPSAQPGVPTLPGGTPLGTGESAVLWANGILTALGAPTSGTNVSALLGWFHAEGGGGQNNPMNTTLHTPDSTGAINSAGVQNYTSPGGGIAATIKTLASYPAIVTSLRAGRGITGPGVAGELSKWSGGGYSSITPISPTGGTDPLQPIENAAGAVGSVGSTIGSVGSSIGSAVSFLTSATTWLRIGEVSAGIVLILLGLKALTGVSAAQIVTAPATATKAAVVG